MTSPILPATNVEKFEKTVVDKEPEEYDQEVLDDDENPDLDEENQDDENPDPVEENQDDENPDPDEENQDDENPDPVEENQDDENPDLVKENQYDSGYEKQEGGYDPNNKEYTNKNDTLGPDNQLSEQTDGPPDALKDATAKQQREDDDKKTALETIMEKQQQIEKTRKDANKVMGTSNKPFVTSNKNNNAAAGRQKPRQKPQGTGQQQSQGTPQQKPQGQGQQRSQGKPQQKPQGLGLQESQEEQQPMESGPTPQPPQKPQTLQKPLQKAQQRQPPPQRKQSASPTQTQQPPQESKVSDTPPQPETQTQARSTSLVPEKMPSPSGPTPQPPQKPQGLGLQESQEEQQPMESGPTPQPPQKPQTLQKPLQKAQQRQPPPLRKQSASPTQTQQPPQESKVSDTPPQPETQTQARSTSLVLEKMPSPSGGVVPTTPTAEEDAANIFRALKGSGCDVGRLVQILSNHDPNHRHEIARHYRNNYNEELSDCICSGLSTSGKGFLKEKVSLDLSINATGSLGWLCKDIKRAVSLWLLEESERDARIVASMDKAALTEVICSRTPAQIRNLKQAYFNNFKSVLSEDIDSSTLLIGSSNTKALLIACLNDRARDEGTNVDLKMADKDATQLYKDGEKIWGTINKTFIDIFTKRNRPHLAAVDDAYDRLYGHSLEEAVRKETSRSFQAGLLTLLKCAKNPAKYFAEVLYNSMKGLGTSDTTLIRVVVTRAGIDMEDIKKEYVEAYKTSLKDYIHKDTSGDYRTFLLNLVE